MYEITRVSILTKEGDVVLDTLVQPRPRYCVQWHNAGDDEERYDVHAAIDALLPPNAILVSHSQNCNLKALKLYQPLIESPDPETLWRHCSIEDCAATMELAQLKLSKDVCRGFNPATYTSQPKIRPLIGGALAHYRRQQCIKYVASLRVVLVAFADDIYIVYVRCFVNKQQSQ